MQIINVVGNCLQVSQFDFTVGHPVLNLNSSGLELFPMASEFADSECQITNDQLAGLDGLRLLQEHLGHASFNTTAKYRKIAGEEHRHWYDRLWRDSQKQEE
jgi:hypothetical protein